MRINLIMKGNLTLFTLVTSLLFCNPVCAELHPALSALEPMPSRTGQAAEQMSFPLGYHADQFYPLGFSRDGKFAYAGGYENACGYCPAVALFDPTNDQKTDSRNFEEEGQQLDAPALEAILGEWQVELDNDMTLHQFPAEIRGNHLDAYLKGWELWLSSAERGSKKVADLGFLKTSTLPSHNELLIEGFYLSPAEDRVVIITSTLLRGFEGEVSLSYHLTGAHLRFGFVPINQDPLPPEAQAHHPALSTLAPMHSKTADVANGLELPLGYNDNRFYPIGFSPIGKFAYAVGAVDGGCGYCPVVKLFDPVNDRTLEQMHFEQEGNHLDTLSLKAIMEQWQITRDEKVSLRAFPLEVGSDRLSAYLMGEELWLRSERHGVKRVADFSTLRHPMLWLEDSRLQIEGFYLSPVEQRMVIIISVLTRGFEGETDLSYYLVGAHLETGFSSPAPSAP